jgi:hypothetical protein
MNLKLFFVGLWVVIGVALVLFVWKRASQAGGRQNTKDAESDFKNLRQLYFYLLNNPEPINSLQAAGLARVSEEKAEQYLAQMEAMGILNHTLAEGQSGYYTLNPYHNSKVFDK